MNIYTPQQAADLLQISKTGLLRLCRSGELKCSKIGRQWRISDEQIARFMTENETAMTADQGEDEQDAEPEPKKRRRRFKPDTRPPEERLRVPDVL